ncbi:MAG: glycine cleavage system protein H [Planctomycetes bacterium]|nr:glycine cleavage system protein H [Planctomycetota bacterium]
MKKKPKDLYYSGGHLWVRVEEKDEAYIGVTDYLTKDWEEVNTVSLPKAKTTIQQDSSLGDIEVDNNLVNLIAPVSGKILEVNAEVLTHPNLLIDDCYEDGWLLRIKIDDPVELESLMNKVNYEEYTEEEEEELEEEEEEEEEI